MKKAFVLILMTLLTVISVSAVDVFTSNGTFEVNQSAFYEVLMVGGGGGGAAGGGGAGGLVYISSLYLAPGNYSVVVGAGGIGGGSNFGPPTAANGENTTFNGIIALGGGAGGRQYVNGSDGGSGGGEGFNTVDVNSAGVGYLNQGYAGGSVAGFVSNPYPSGGGGGCGGVGQDAQSNSESGDGGIGCQYSITGTPTYYAGGGGGSCWASCTAGTGGLGGGGNAPSGSGTDGLGGGGSGATNGQVGGSGGDGIVILKFLSKAGIVTGCPDPEIELHDVIYDLTGDCSGTNYVLKNNSGFICNGYSITMNQSTSPTNSFIWIDSADNVSLTNCVIEVPNLTGTYTAMITARGNWDGDAGRDILLENITIRNSVGDFRAVWIGQDNEGVMSNVTVRNMVFENVTVANDDLFIANFIDSILVDGMTVKNTVSGTGVRFRGSSFVANNLNVSDSSSTYNILMVHAGSTGLLNGYLDNNVNGTWPYLSFSEGDVNVSNVVVENKYRDPSLVSVPYMQWYNASGTMNGSSFRNITGSWLVVQVNNASLEIKESLFENSYFNTTSGGGLIGIYGNNDQTHYANIHNNQFSNFIGTNNKAGVYAGANSTILFENNNITADLSLLPTPTSSMQIYSFFGSYLPNYLLIKNNSVNGWYSNTMGTSVADIIYGYLNGPGRLDFVDNYAGDLHGVIYLYGEQALYTNITGNTIERSNSSYTHAGIIYPYNSGRDGLYILNNTMRDIYAGYQAIGLSAMKNYNVLVDGNDFRNMDARVLDFQYSLGDTFASIANITVTNNYFENVTTLSSYQPKSYVIALTGGALQDRMFMRINNNVFNGTHTITLVRPLGFEFNNNYAKLILSTNNYGLFQNSYQSPRGCVDCNMNNNEFIFSERTPAFGTSNLQICNFNGNNLYYMNSTTTSPLTAGNCSEFNVIGNYVEAYGAMAYEAGSNPSQTAGLVGPRIVSSANYAGRSSLRVRIEDNNALGSVPLIFYSNLHPVNITVRNNTIYSLAGSGAGTVIGRVDYEFYDNVAYPNYNTALYPTYGPNGVYLDMYNNQFMNAVNYNVSVGMYGVYGLPTNATLVGQFNFYNNNLNGVYYKYGALSNDTSNKYNNTYNFSQQVLIASTGLDPAASVYVNPNDEALLAMNNHSIKWTGYQEQGPVMSGFNLGGCLGKNIDGGGLSLDSVFVAYSQTCTIQNFNLTSRPVSYSAVALGSNNIASYLGASANASVSATPVALSQVSISGVNVSIDYGAEALDYTFTTEAQALPWYVSYNMTSGSSFVDGDWSTYDENLISIPSGQYGYYQFNYTYGGNWSDVVGAIWEVKDHFSTRNLTISANCIYVQNYDYALRVEARSYKGSGSQNRTVFGCYAGDYNIPGLYFVQSSSQSGGNDLYEQRMYFIIKNGTSTSVVAAEPAGLEKTTFVPGGDCSIYGQDLSCGNFTLDYYNEPGYWSALINVSDVYGSSVVSANNAVSYSLLIDKAFDTETIKFSNTIAGQTNMSSDNLITVSNTGNGDITSISLTAYDLVGANGMMLSASYFRAGTTLTDSVMLQNGVPVSVPFNLTAGLNSSATFRLWVSAPSSVLPQQYVSGTPWVTTFNI